MIVVRIELWPYGAASAAKEISRIYVADVGGTVETGFYTCAAVPEQMLPSDETASGAPWPIAKDGFPSEATGRVESYPRRLGVFNLLARALHAMGFR